MSGSRVAVVTVAYHSEDDLDELLSSLERSTVAPESAIISDNGSNPGVLEALVERHPGATVLRNDANLGYGGAVNAAAATLPSTIEWILVVNPDVVLDADTLEQLLDTAVSAPDIASVGPLIRNTDGTVYPSARPLPSLSTGIGHALLATASPGNPWTQRYRATVAAAGEQPRDVGWLSGSCVLIRRELFDRVGGFDDRYFMYFEDVDLGRRLALIGGRNVYDPGSGATHHGAHSTRPRAVPMMRVHHESAYRYLANVYDGWYQWPLRVALRLGLSARSALLARSMRRRGRPGTDQ